MKQSDRSPGFKYFYALASPDSSALSISKIGIREIMPPCVIERPRGTGDYLVMLFHDPARAACTSGGGGLHEPDTMMIWTPGKGQYYGNPDRGYCHTWIHCKGSQIRRILRSSELPVLEPFRIPAPTLFEQCLLAIHREMVSFTHPDEVIIGAHLEICFREIARIREGELGKEIRIPENLLTVKRWIGPASARKVSLEEMAGVAGMSISHFTFLFKKHFGLPPMKYLLQHRMLHAAHLLANKNFSISEIAAKVGYDDLFHFSKMFKKQFGMSPRKMRGL